MKNNLLQQKKIMVIAILISIIVVLGIGGCLFYTSNLKAVSSNKNDVVFEVRAGETSDIVLVNLKEEKLIKNPTIAKLYMKFHGLTDIKAGFFSISSSMDTKEIVAILNDNSEAKAKQVRITFKEGMWAKNMATLIEEKMGVSKDELLSLWNDDTYLKEQISVYPFLSEEILNSQFKVKLEGYLFPETYTFKKDASAKDITKTFLDHFQTVYDTYATQIKSSTYSTQEIITLASMVQYEAATKKDMDLVAGVFFNRLAIDMPLQSSVTVCYSLYDKMKSADDCEVNSDIDSPYNTYLHNGLPIGPILNPGEDAIRAVLYPQASDYLYFVADIYGDGSVHYATTLAEHEANVDKYNLRK